MKLIIKSTLIFSLPLLSFSAFSQNTVTQNDKKNTEVVEKSKVPTELKAAPETFYIVNDQPVSYEVYAKHLRQKEEEKEKAKFENSLPK